MPKVPVVADITTDQLAEMQREREHILFALRDCVEAMEMQERRETGEFHIPQPSAWAIWSVAKAEAMKFVQPRELKPEHAPDRTGTPDASLVEPSTFDPQDEESQLVGICDGCGGPYSECRGLHF